jgi:hypothetical protein
VQASGSKPGWASAQIILGPDPQLALYGETIVWFHKVELFRREEEERMYRQKPSQQDLAFHKNLLQRLITDGDHLTHLIEQHGFLANAEGFSGDDLRATLQNLRADYRGWHEPMAAGQRSKILREVFDGPQRPH